MGGLSSAAPLYACSTKSLLSKPLIRPSSNSELLRYSRRQNVKLTTNRSPISVAFADKIEKLKSRSSLDRQQALSSHNGEDEEASLPLQSVADSSPRADQELQAFPGGAPASQPLRLFSNLNEATLTHEPGSLTSSILLIAGTTVGAGILAIPAVTQEAGFLASAPTCVACWLYMVTTGLLVAEVNVNTMCELGSGGVSLVSIAERTLGWAGASVACLTYALIHYALLVAYVARASTILATAGALPPELAAVAFTAAFGSLCYFGSQRAIGLVNGLLVALILGSFSLLLALAWQSADLSALLRADFSAVPASVPIIALSFVYQNVVPVVATQLEGDLPRIRTAVLLGTALPLAMFLLWDAAILSSLPALPPGTPASSDPLAALRDSSGLVGPAVEFFSFFAVSTSYVGFVLGLSDFLADWLKLPSGRGQEPLPFVLCLLPPLGLALLNPGAFFQALDVAGTYGVLVLFGIIPAAMAWSERYSEASLKPLLPPIVPGGRWTLAAVMASATTVILANLWTDVGSYLGL